MRSACPSLRRTHDAHPKIVEELRARDLDEVVVFRAASFPTRIAALGRGRCRGGLHSGAPCGHRRLARAHSRFADFIGSHAGFARTHESSSWISSSIQGKQLFARYGTPSPRRRRGDRRRGGARRDAAGFPSSSRRRCRWAGGARPRYKLAENADRCASTRNILAWTSRATSSSGGLGLARLGHRRGVLRVVHARSQREEVPRVVERAGRRRDRRRSPDENPDASCGCRSTRSTV